REHVAGGRAAADVVAMPERIKEQRPGGEAQTALTGMREEPRDGARIADLPDAGLVRDQRPERGAPAPNPFTDRNGKALLAHESRRLGHLLSDPAPEQPFAQAIADFELVREPEGELREHGIEEWRASLDTMRHQTTIKLAQEIVRQPVR